MPQHVSGRYNFGASITETGLNLVSSALRVAKPELFQKTNDVTIVPPQPANPGHILHVTAIALEPVVFDFFPIAGLPQLGADTFFVQVKLDIALTDNILGLVTRIKAEIQAAGSFIQPATPGGAVHVRVEKRPDGTDYLDILNIEGDDPGAKLIERAVAGGAEISTEISADDDSQLGRSFRAIVNYLINLFLKENLKRVILEYPVPGLDQLVTLGPLGTVPVEEIHCQNNALYFWMGNEEIPAPAPFPDAPVPSADIRIGATDAGLHRIVKASLPLPINFDPKPTDVIQLLGEGLQVYDILFKLIPWLFPFPLPAGTPQIPGINNIPAAILISGTLIIRISFKIFGKQISFDIPIPFDQLTSYWGSFVPVMTVETLTPEKPDAIVECRAIPATGFADAWFALIVTDYRDYFARAIRAKLDSLRDEVIGQDFCNIPIIGWFVCGVITLASKIIEVAAWLCGAALDAAVSPFLTDLVNVAMRVLRLFKDAPSGRLFKLDQAKLYDQLGLTLATAQMNVINNGRGGELLLEASFNGTGVPIPPPPPVPAPLPDPVIPPLPPPPGANSLPEYTATDFQPPYTLPAPTFVDGLVETFDVDMDDGAGNTDSGLLKITYAKLPAGWSISHVLTLKKSGVTMTTRGQYDAAFNPVQLQTTSSQPSAVSHKVTYLATGVARVELQIGPASGNTRDVALRGGIGSDLEMLWVFRLARADLTAVAGVVFARIETSNPVVYVNWARQIPVKLTITAGTTTPIGSTDPLATWEIMAVDEENQVHLSCAQDKSGLFQMSVKHDQITINIKKSAALLA